MICMAAVKGRTQRKGVGASTVQMNLRVSTHMRTKVQRAADALKISEAAYLDALLEREELDDQGRPLWWRDPVPGDQEELPLPQSA